jgi:3-oxoacyl-[acyl-carrier protein] reductase
MHTGAAGESTSTGPVYPDLAGKVAVVTGSSRGIGAATARALARNGVRVVVNGRDDDAVNVTTQMIRDAGGEATGVVADAGQPDGLERLREQAQRAYGPVDILGAFVGGSGRPPEPITDIPRADWQATLDLNLSAPFLALREFLPSMTARGSGAIVTLASAAARLAGGPSGAPTAYAVAKAGLVRLTQEAAREGGPHGVRVNCVVPSTILTERLERLIPVDLKEQMTRMHPLGRLGTPADVASAVLFLASDSASWITGVTLDIAGGQVMR